MRGVSLEELSSATRISTRFLTAIENGQWQELPGGAFNRGFIRSASRYLGLDEDGMVAEYALETSGGALPVVLPAPNKRHVHTLSKWRGQTGPKRHARAGADKRPVWLRVAALCGVGVLIVAGGWFAGTKIEHRLHARTADAPARYGGFVRARTSNDPARPATAPSGLALAVQATSAARVTVKADGKTLFDGEVKAGEEKTFTAAKAFAISTDDAAAVRLELNGQPVAPMGLAKRPGSITLTAKDAKSSIAGGGAGGSHQF